MNDNYTMRFSATSKNEMMIKEIFQKVTDAMIEKGYNAVDQWVGFIISGDPGYITSYKDARNMVVKVDRDELLEHILRFYIKNAK